MEYTVARLAKLSGVSARTLRYYDQIGLLRPRRLSSSGYRIYGAQEVGRLQQILFYRRLELPLERIRDIVLDPGFDPKSALASHRRQLLAEREKLERLLRNVENTLRNLEEETSMTDAQRFEGLKDEMIAENEAKYGKEVRERWGDAAADESNRRLKGKSQADFEAQQALAVQVNETLGQAMAQGDPRGPLARQAVERHKRWLDGWGDYSPEAHVGLGEMYVEDERFAAYYDQVGPGAAQFLRDAIRAYYQDA